MTEAGGAGWHSAEAIESALTAAFGVIDRERMADVPICNRVLRVEAYGFRYDEAQGIWIGALITPWAVNLIILPAAAALTRWPAVAPGGKQHWRFPHGAYEFTVAEESAIGVYHLCSLFSPPVEFASHGDALMTMHTVLDALLRPAPDEAAWQAGLSGDLSAADATSANSSSGEPTPAAPVTPAASGGEAAAPASGAPDRSRRAFLGLGRRRG